MAKPRDHKTNAVRALDAANLDYEFRVFECADAVPSGVEVAAMLGRDPDQVFKTLVTVGEVKRALRLHDPRRRGSTSRKRREPSGKKRPSP